MNKLDMTFYNVRCQPGIKISQEFANSRDYRSYINYSIIRFIKDKINAILYNETVIEDYVVCDA